MPLILAGATSGQATVQATDAATVTLTLPATSGTVALTSGGGSPTFTTVTATTVATSNLTIGGTALGAGDSSAMKNRIINGAMTISQRNGTSSVTVSGDPVYTLDRWYLTQSQNSKFSIQQDAGAVTPPAGFIDYLGATVVSAVTVGTNDYFALAQAIEGFNVSDLGFGTANAKTVTLSFWVRSSLTGTFGGSLSNGAEGRSYPFTYTIGSANTWTQITQTFTGDVTGTWATGNTAGMKVFFGLGTGSTYAKTAGSWQAGTSYSATGATSVVGTNGATFYITGVQLEVGTQATSFEYRQYGTELNLCQRYFQIVGGNAASLEHWAMGVMNTNRINIIYGLKQTMRASPSFTATSFGSSFGDLTIYAGVTTYVVTGSSENYMATNNVSIGFNHGGSSTAGAAGYIYFNSTNARVAFSAEL